MSNIPQNRRWIYSVHRFPKMLLEIYDSIIFHLHSFVFEQLLHHGRRGKMMATTKFSLAVDDSVSRHTFTGKTFIKCPADHTCRAKPKVVGNGAVCGYSASRYHAGDLVHVLEIIVFCHNFKVKVKRQKAKVNCYFCVSYFRNHFFHAENKSKSLICDQLDRCSILRCP